MKPLLNKQTLKSDAAFRAIAAMPTKSLPVLMDNEFARSMSDANFMRVAVLLAQKSYDEGGCPIGAVIIDNDTRQIMGKGHNTLVQDNNPYNHGETAAIRDAGRIDFGKTTLFTSLSPCAICTALIGMRGFGRVVVGDATSAPINEAALQERGVRVELLEDSLGIELYARFRAEKPDLDLEDWQGRSAVHKKQQ